MGPRQVPVGYPTVWVAHTKQREAHNGAYYRERTHNCPTGAPPRPHSGELMPWYISDTNWCRVWTRMYFKTEKKTTISCSFKKTGSPQQVYLHASFSRVLHPMPFRCSPLQICAFSHGIYCLLGKYVNYYTIDHLTKNQPTNQPSTQILCITC